MADKFDGKIDDMPYDEYMEMLKNQREEDAKKQAKEKKSEAGDATTPNAEEGGYQPESFSGEGGYDDYLANQDGGGATAADADLSDSKGGGKTDSMDVADKQGDGSSGGGAKSSDANVSDSLLSKGENATAETVRDATPGEAVTGVGTRMVEGVKNMGRGLLKGIRSSVFSMFGSIGQLAETLHVSARALSAVLILLGGGGVTFLGITFFGQEDLGKYVTQDDCRVNAVVRVDYTSNDVYKSMTQQAMDGNARTLYKSLSNKNLINGVIGFEYIVGQYSGAMADPYLQERSRTHESSADGQPGYKKFGETEDGKIVPASSINGTTVKAVWVYDVYMDRHRWDHGPATLKDTDTGILNVLPGGSDRITANNQENAAVASRSSTGNFPGLSDNRKHFDQGFTDEAIIGMILNAEAESSVNPGCWEAMKACFYYLETEGTVNPSDILNGGGHPGGKNTVMATTHHRDWNRYVIAMKEWWREQHVNIDLNSYHYVNRWNEEEELDGTKLYYPGVGLWQWTGARAYALQEWSNLLLGLSDNKLDTSNDAMYAINTQIYYVLFENYNKWDGDETKPQDFAGQARKAVGDDAQPLKDTVDNNRVSLIDWGVYDRVVYQETYYVNIPNRPDAEKIQQRERTATHTFTNIHEITYTKDASGNETGDTEIETNHDNLVRPQFDYVYTLDNQSHTYHAMDGTIDMVDDNHGNRLREVDLERLGEVYDMMIHHPKRPACPCNKCVGCSHSPWEESEIPPKCPCKICTCTPTTAARPAHADGCTPTGCSPSWCYHQCQLDTEKNIRNMINNLMQTYYTESGEIWWHGLEEPDFLDVGSRHSDTYSCGDNMYKNLKDTPFESSLSAAHNLTIYKVKWYYDVSVEVEAQYTNGRTIHDVDNMGRTNGGEVYNGNAKRPDILSYKGTSDNPTDAGDQIIYESTPEAVKGYLPGKVMFGEDKDTEHPGTDTGKDGYSATYHKNWMKGTDDAVQNEDRDVYMYRSYGSVKTTQWGNYLDAWYKTATDGTIALDAKLPGGTNHIGWTQALFDAWWGLEDTEVKLHKCKLPYGEGSAEEFIDRYYRMRLSSYAHGSITSALGTRYTDWKTEEDGHIAEKNVSKPDFVTEFVKVGTPHTGHVPGPWSYPDHPVEPMIKDLGDGGSQGAGISSGGMDSLRSNVYAATDALQALIDAGKGPGDAEYDAAQSAVDTASAALSAAEAAEAAATAGNAAVANAMQSADIRGIWGDIDYKFVRKYSDDLMWWAESRAIAQVSRVCAREYTLKWEGSSNLQTTNGHSRFGSAVHYAVQMLTDKWSADKSQAKSIMDMWYEDMSNAPLQTWWRSFYRNYCGTAEGFGGIADCAVKWAWLQGHPDTATHHNEGPKLGGGQYMETFCTELYVETKKILEKIPLTEPMPGLYSSCDRGVCTAVHAAGADDEFPWGAARHQLDYARSSGKWEEIGQVSSFSNLEPGDLLLSTHHVIVFTGGEAAEKKWPNEISAGSAENGIVHSSLSASIDSSRGPRFDPNAESYVVGAGDFYAFRLVGEPDVAGSACKAAIDAEASRLESLPDGTF